MKGRVLIGMEVHLQLRTQSKMFCRCRVAFGAPPNTHVCPVCLGLPGALPVPNRDALLMALSLASALGCELAEVTAFDRKNYFYPDLPKGYQISQLDRPIGRHGRVEIVTGEGVRPIRIRRLHLEEDTGKSLHDEAVNLSRVDLNRAGTPLVEIVSEPDLASAAEARAYVAALKTLVEYLDVSDANMQEGNLRCEPNVNLHFGDVATPIVEIKNLNSLRNLERAVRLEIERQTRKFEKHGAAFAAGPRETRGYDDEKDQTYPLRKKEEEHDYRYFPEPDIPPITVGAAWRKEAAARVPELPHVRRARFVAEYGLPAYDADGLCRDRAAADYYEKVVKAGCGAKPAANWILTELARHANDRGVALADLGLPPAQLATLVRMVEAGAVARRAAQRAVLPRMLESGAEPEQIVAELGLAQVDDAEALRAAAARAVAANPDAVRDVKAGKAKALGALMGHVMRETGGKANPKVVRSVLNEILEKA